MPYWGVPYDLGTTNRSGARSGPRAIREQSALVGEYEWGVWPWDYHLSDRHRMVDYGDVCDFTAYPERMTAELERIAGEIIRQDTALLSLGGDHFISLPLLRAHVKKHGPVALVHFDAHSDTWVDKDYNHGTMFYHAVQEGLIDLDHSIQIGIRTPNPDSFGLKILDAIAMDSMANKDIAAVIRDRVQGQKTYLSFDIDFLDPAFAPGTGTPVSGGATVMQGREIPRGLKGLNIIGGDLVEARDMADYIGTDVYCGGLYNNLDGHLHPLNLCMGEARAAAGLGVEIFEASAVTGIRHGKNPVVMTDRGQVKAQKIVLAGNAYHHLEQKKLGGILFPAGTYIIATESLDEDLAQQIMPGDLAVCDVNEILDYYRLSADRRMLFGGKCTYSGRDPKSIRDSMLPNMLRIFPQLKDVKIDYEWGGIIGIVINRTPHVGRINGNIYYAEGYSGHGVNASHILSEILSDAITGQMERFDIFAKARQTSLPVPRWMGNQMVALGMLYYRIKDLF